MSSHHFHSRGLRPRDGEVDPGRSVTPSQGSRRSVTPTRRGRVGPGPLGGLGEETLQEIEALEEYTLRQHRRTDQPGGYGSRHRY